MSYSEPPMDTCSASVVTAAAQFIQALMEYRA